MLKEIYEASFFLQTVVIALNVHPWVMKADLMTIFQSDLATHRQEIAGLECIDVLVKLAIGPLGPVPMLKCSTYGGNMKTKHIARKYNF